VVCDPKLGLMFDSALYHPSSPRHASAEDWRNQRLRDLQSELESTREQLEVFRRATAQVLTAILTELNTRTATTATVTEIQKLTDLAEVAAGDSNPEPFSAEIESIDAGNQESLAYLDRRYRWLPSRKSRD
jgi:hypothetical protein